MASSASVFDELVKVRRKEISFLLYMVDRSSTQFYYRLTLQLEELDNMPE
jgi:hypothetical protein